MEISSPRDMSISEDLKRSHDLNQLSLDLSHCTCGVTEDVYLNDLGDDPILHIEDDQKSESESTLVPPSDKNDFGYMEKEDKLVTVNSDEFANALSDGEEEDELDNMSADVVKGSGYETKKPVILPVPLPPCSKLRSAIKGSREKQETPPNKLTVTWAPDVYDPPPSIPSHVATNKKQRNRSESKKEKIESKKGGGKNKQKGGGAKPTKGKDKKQFRKHGGSSNRGYNLLDDDAYGEPYSDLGGFDVGSPDSYCGSSFLKKSVGKTRISLAEAT